MDINRGELEHLRNPSEKLRTNSWVKLSNREKRELIVSSKTFTVLATIGTLGLYYIYYLFCLEQKEESPFNKKPVEDENGKHSLGYTWQKAWYENEAWEEADKFNKRLCNLAESKKNISLWEKYKLRAEKHTHKKTIWFVLVLNQICGKLEKLVYKVSGKNIEINLLKRHKEKKINYFNKKEEQIKKFINEKLRERMEKPIEEFDIAKSFEETIWKKNKPIKDNFLTFFYMTSYAIASIVTLGVFPVWHMIVKERWDDFKVIKKHREHANIRDFDSRIERLINGEGKLEYSLLLISERNIPFSITPLCKSYRTKVFRDEKVRKKIITLLMFLTLGLFGIVIMSDNAFDSKITEVKLEEHKEPINYKNISSKKERFKAFLKDLLIDIRVSSMFAANREKQINDSIRNLIKIQEKEDRWTYLFMKTISSPMYYWAFTLCCWFSCIIAIAMMVTSSSAFWIIFGIIGIFSFFYLFVRHIQLLFV